jgi:hypothetical protein
MVMHHRGVSIHINYQPWDSIALTVAQAVTCGTQIANKSEALSKILRS